MAMPDLDLEVDRVSKRYGAHLAVDDLSLAVRRGSFFSILGPSGCGKTTLLRIIAGFLEPDSGDVRIGGRAQGGGVVECRPVELAFCTPLPFPSFYLGRIICGSVRARRLC